MLAGPTPALPAACRLPRLAEISHSGQGCVYFAINKEQRKWQRRGDQNSCLVPGAATEPGGWEGCRCPHHLTAV